ncbi:MAG: hypothetical protein NTW61_00330 [Candidatus Melainabacteria bacterium]|jgi:hypothetical protein|nr:hypothetical protein [Candidatus Melainabacteria bacterium]
MMTFSFKRLLPFFLVLMTIVATQLATQQAQATTPTIDTLYQQGYSPEMIEMTTIAQSRAEWRGIAPPRRSPMKQLLQNIWTGNLTDGIDPFGYTIVRRH